MQKTHITHKLALTSTHTQLYSHILGELLAIERSEREKEEYHYFK